VKRSETSGMVLLWLLPDVFEENRLGHKPVLDDPRSDHCIFLALRGIPKGLREDQPGNADHPVNT